MGKKDRQQPRILIIDDEQQVQDVLCEILADSYECTTASSAEEGLDILQREQFSVVISDINMAGISGLTMVPRILTLAPDTVVIMMSGAQAIENAIDALRVGAFDYIVKPFDVRHVEAAIGRAMEHYSLRVVKRDYANQLEEKVRERTADLLKTTHALQQEIEERNRAEERLNFLSYHDPLTTLPNRTLFEDRLTQALKSNSDRQTLAVLLFSLNQMQHLSDTLGRTVEDRLICEVAERLKKSVREGDTLAYYGGHEFVLLMPHVVGPDDAVEVADRVQQIIGASFNVDEREIYLSVSTGIVMSPVDGVDYDSLIKNVRAASLQAQQRGGNAWCFYAADMNSKALERLTLETELRRAIERDEFIIHYQPKVDVSDWQIKGAEALIRWNHPELGLISPAKFIPLAEDTGLIVPIGLMTLRKACAQLNQWHAEGFDNLTLSVNLCARQFEQKDLTHTILQVLEETAVAPCYLELEITESSIMSNTRYAVRVLNELQQFGIRVSVDDFGTGFSSLGYLKQLPIDVLKIDQSFVRDVTENPDDAALVMAIITLAHNLRLKVIAEGVETEEQLRFLRLLRCDEIQGYLFSRPVPASQFKQLLATGEAIAQTGERLKHKPGSVDRNQLISAA